MFSEEDWGQLWEETRLGMIGFFTHPLGRAATSKLEIMVRRAAKVKSRSFIFRWMLRLKKYLKEWWTMGEWVRGVSMRFDEAKRIRFRKGQGIWLLYTSAFSPPFLASASIGHELVVWPPSSRLRRWSIDATCRPITALNPANVVHYDDCRMQ